MTLVAEIGDISRFPDARKLCAWSGLTPKVRNSDQTVHHGRITKQGPAAVRAVLVEAAQTAKLRRLSLTCMTRFVAGEAVRSPPSRWPAGFWPSPFTSCRR